MGERKDLRDLLRDTDFTQKRIIDDLANSGSEAGYEEREVIKDIRRSEGGDFIKNFFVGLLLIAIVVGSFWVSFFIGKKILVPPVKYLPTTEVIMPKTVSPIEVEKAAPAREEEPALPEKEIKAIEVKAQLPKPITAAKPVATPPAVKKPAVMKFYKVIVANVKTAEEAYNITTSLRQNGFQSYVKVLAGSLRIQAGAFDTKDKAVPLVAKLKAKGFSPTIIVE
jgi:hypothetical protein